VSWIKGADMTPPPVLLYDRFENNFPKGEIVPVPYAQRRQRRQQLAEGLHPSLRGQIALRHIETVSKFSPEVQSRLAEAIDAGVRIPVAVQFLKENPDAIADEIILKCQKTTSKHRQNEKQENRPAPDVSDLSVLVDLLRNCFPDMPQATAEAMAGSELLSEVLAIVRSQQVCFRSHHAQSEFVIVVLCGLALRNIEQLKQIIPRRTIYHLALQQSGVEWPY